MNDRVNATCRFVFFFESIFRCRNIRNFMNGDAAHVREIGWFINDLVRRSHVLEMNWGYWFEQAPQSLISI